MASELTGISLVKTNTYMESLLNDIKQCKICLPFLKDGVNPVVTASPKSKIAIVGKAPGRLVHNSGITWDDKSGDRLRDWLNMSKDEFYNTDDFAIIPMGFCYPGKGKTGDLPPRSECAPKWHSLLFEQLQDLKLVLLIGQFAQRYYLKDKMKRTLTETLINYNAYLPNFLPLPHPSLRNNIWLRKNSWFEECLVPDLRLIVNNAVDK